MLFYIMLCYIYIYNLFNGKKQQYMKHINKTNKTYKNIYIKHI